MQFSFKTRRRSIATHLLFVWLVALFVNVAQACLPASNQTAYAGTAIGVLEHETCVDEDSAHHPDACKPHCDAQMQDAVKANSFDPAGVDRPVRYFYVSFSPWNPDGGSVVSAFTSYSLLYDPTISLRFTRLTL